MRDRDCVAFLQWALPRLGLRWAGFRKPRRQVCRRIARRLGEIGIADLDAYRRRLRDDPGEWEALEPLCRVTISRFFRDRGVFAGLERVVLPELVERARAAGRPVLDAWSAGCASGEEPYSLAILWHRSPDLDRLGVDLRIVATDADPHLLGRARRARYAAGSLREVPAEWRAWAFVERDGGFELRPEVTAGVDLRCEDLRRAAPAGPFDLVLCRNLAFTYYDEHGQAAVLETIASRLRPGGALVLGRHEAPPVADRRPPSLEPVAGAPSSYRASG